MASATWKALERRPQGTNYVLAGFVALGALGESAWDGLQQAQIFPQPLTAKYARCTFANTGSLNKSLDVPGGKQKRKQSYLDYGM